MGWEDCIDKIDWDVKSGEGGYGDYPDHVDYYYNGEKVWEDDFNDPDAVQIYNCMLTAFKEDMFMIEGKYYSEWREQ